MGKSKAQFVSQHGSYGSLFCQLVFSAYRKKSSNFRLPNDMLLVELEVQLLTFNNTVFPQVNYLNIQVSLSVVGEHYMATELGKVPIFKNPSDYALTLTLFSFSQSLTLSLCHHAADFMEKKSIFLFLTITSVETH